MKDISKKLIKKYSNKKSLINLIWTFFEFIIFVPVFSVGFYLYFANYTIDYSDSIKQFDPLLILSLILILVGLIGLFLSLSLQSVYCMWASDKPLRVKKNV